MQLIDPSHQHRSSVKLEEGRPFYQDQKSRVSHSQQKEEGCQYSTSDFSSVWAQELELLPPGSQMECPRYLLTFLIFLHIKPAQQHDSLFSAESAVRRIWRVNARTSIISIAILP